MKDDILAGKRQIDVPKPSNSLHRPNLILRHVRLTLMRLRSSYLYSIAALSVFARGETQRPFIGQPSPVSSISIPLADHFNNKATSIGGENDGIGLTNGSTYPTEYLPTGQWLDDGVVVSFIAQIVLKLKNPV